MENIDIIFNLASPTPLKDVRAENLRFESVIADPTEFRGLSVGCVQALIPNRPAYTFGLSCNLWVEAGTREELKMLAVMAYQHDVRAKVPVPQPFLALPEETPEQAGQRVVWELIRLRNANEIAATEPLLRDSVGLPKPPSAYINARTAMQAEPTITELSNVVITGMILTLVRSK